MIELKKLQKKAKELNSEKEVPLKELMPDDFIRNNTNFQTLQAILDAGGIQNKKALSSKKFSKFIATHTRFSTWEEMIKAAGVEYAKRKLGL